ncbi:SOS response-associated protein YedK [Gammaproteobacteria bacterium]|nr:SOS response-associated protein YedK [Gammaproteobacteria bacterium]
MCGRFIIKSDLEQIQLAFSIDQVEAQVQPSYNIAPTQSIVTVAQRDGQNVLENMRWGLIPVWAKDMSIGSKMINARAESVAEKASFKRPLKSRRCLIVADGFYEWQKEGAKKIPMFIHLKSQKPFAFAGLYDVWKSPDGDWITSCAIITTRPNELMETIHNRMPVILPKTAYKPWLDVSNQDLDELIALLQPYPADKMLAYPVSPLVNSPRNNSPECIQAIR